MYCKNCGKEITEDSKFCPYCGTEQTLIESNSSEYDLEAESSLADLDPLFEEVGYFVVTTGQASTSTVQRKFNIGYNRAGRIMDQLERVGIVDVARGYQPREVLIVDTDSLKSLYKQLNDIEDYEFPWESKKLDETTNELENRVKNENALSNTTQDKLEKNQPPRRKMSKSLKDAILKLWLIPVILGCFMNCQKSCEESHNDYVPHASRVAYHTFREYKHDYAHWSYTLGYILIAVGVGAFGCYIYDEFKD